MNCSARVERTRAKRMILSEREFCVHVPRKVDTGCGGGGVHQWLEYIVSKPTTLLHEMSLRARSLLNSPGQFSLFI